MSHIQLTGLIAIIRLCESQCMTLTDMGCRSWWVTRRILTAFLMNTLPSPPCWRAVPIRIHIKNGPR